jgi:hypothetical protein
MRHVLFGILLASAAFAQSKPGVLRFFMNGAGVDMHTESSGGHSPLSMSGFISDGPPAHRIVLDNNDNPLFAYDIEIKRLPDGRVTMRIMPLNPEYVARTFPSRRFKAPTPTLTAARDFPPLNVGDEVQVDILYRPSTGEKLWDVLKVIEDRESYPRSPTAERFSFERFTVTIDGKVVAEQPGVWMVGRALKMSLPGYGDYYIVLTATADFPFQTGWVDHNVLRFKAGGRQVEITGKSNILRHSDFGTVWIYSEAHDLVTLNEELKQALKTYTPSHPRVRELQRRIAVISSGDGIDFHCADNMDQLYPKEQRLKDE